MLGLVHLLGVLPAMSHYGGLANHQPPVNIDIIYRYIVYPDTTTLKLQQLVICNDISSSHVVVQVATMEPAMRRLSTEMTRARNVSQYFPPLPCLARTTRQEIRILEHS
jgi:hypothetical protein